MFDLARIWSTRYCDMLFSSASPRTTSEERQAGDASVGGVASVAPGARPEPVGGALSRGFRGVEAAGGHAGVAVEVEEEFVELRRRDRGAGEHRVGLAAVVDLVLEEVGEERVDALARAAVGVADHLDAAVEVGGRQPVAEADQPAVGGGLGGAERGGLGKVGVGGRKAARPRPVSSSASR